MVPKEIFVPASFRSSRYHLRGQHISSEREGHHTVIVASILGIGGQGGGYTLRGWRALWRWRRSNIKCCRGADFAGLFTLGRFDRNPNPYRTLHSASAPASTVPSTPPVLPPPQYITHVEVGSEPHEAFSALFLRQIETVQSPPQPIEQ